MKITEVIKKDGSKVYRANVYLGVDQVTGKKVKTKVTGRTQKEVKQKANQEKIAFQKAGSTRQKAITIKTIKNWQLSGGKAIRIQLSQTLKETLER